MSPPGKWHCGRHNADTTAGAGTDSRNLGSLPIAQLVRDQRNGKKPQRTQRNTEERLWRVKMPMAA